MRLKQDWGQCEIETRIRGSVRLKQDWGQCEIEAGMGAERDLCRRGGERYEIETGGRGSMR
jgi:hypothetical protein